MGTNAGRNTCGGVGTVVRGRRRVSAFERVWVVCCLTWV